MRTLLKGCLLGLCLVLGLTQLAAPSHGQSALLPPGRPVLFGKGILPTQIVNVPIDASASIVPVPGQQVGFFMPAFRKLMSPVKTGVFQGVSAVPDASQFPGAVFPRLPAVPKAK